jgi:transglutaminase-like putative cysteine protease
MAEKHKRISLLQTGVEPPTRTVTFSQALSALLALWCVLLALRDSMDSALVLTASMAVGAVVLVLRYLACAREKADRAVSIGLYIVTLALLLGGLSYAYQGLLTTANHVIYLWNGCFATQWVAFSLTGDSALGSLVFWTLLTVPLGSIFFRLVSQRRVVWTTVGLLVPLLASFVLSRSSLWGAVGCGVLALGISSVASQNPHRGMRRGGMSAVVLTVLALFLAGLCFWSYDGSQRLTDWKSAVTRQVERLRYGSDSLPQGDLTRADRLLLGDDFRLQITMEEPENLYLRGFVGAEYTGSAWESLSPVAYLDENDGILTWLSQQGLVPVTQYAAYDALGQDSPVQTISVKNIGADRRYAYLPYSAQAWDADLSAQAERDWQVRSKSLFGVRQYSFTALVGAPSAEEVLTDSWLQDPETEAQTAYVQAEAVYHQFVEENYLSIDPAVKAVIDQMFFDGGLEQDMDFGRLTAILRQVLRENTSYTAHPEALPEGEDYILWFLTQAKSGNAVAYASAAVMVYRAAGYPARYVEGYRLGDNTVRTMLLLGDKTTTLTTQNAHAWVEVYVSGMGWMPVEVVPGMYAESVTTQVVEGQPEYRVNAVEGEDGLDIANAGGTGQTVEPEPETGENVDSSRWGGWVLLVLYGLFGLFLVLEGQRSVRVWLRRRWAARADDDGLVWVFSKHLYRGLRLARVEGNYNHPLELAPSIREKLPDMNPWAYERVVFLVQKVRFGREELRPYEKHALADFLAHMAQTLYRQHSGWRSFCLRYIYAVET